MPHHFTSKISLLSTCAIFTLACSMPAFSQVPDAATTTADPGRIQNQFLDNIDIPNVSSKVEVKDLILQELPEGAEEIDFKLNSLELEDYTAYELSELETVYADKIGQVISLADLYAIATALTNKYRNDGYILTQVIVPPQTIDGGNVKLRVVEGFIENISVEGAEESGSALELIQRYAEGIKTNEAINVRDLERYLLFISDLPGLDARSVLSPSTTTTGAADLRIIVERDPYDAFLSIDNYGTRFLGPVQITAGATLNSIFGNNESITAQIVAAPDAGTNAQGDLELGYLALNYRQPVPFFGKGATIDLLASHTDTTPGFTLETFDIEGISQFLRARITYPFIRSRSKNLSGYMGLDWRNVRSASNVQDTLIDNIRTFRAGGTYEFLDTNFGVGINGIGFEFSRGLGILGASNAGDANLSRASGDPEFTKLTADIQRLQRVTSDVNLLLAATGQLSNGPLLSSEEFGVGGTNYGRGYDSSEITGDEGFAGKAELQWKEPKDISFIDSYELYGFFDAGRVFEDDATTNAQKTDTLTSTGFGVRAEFGNGLEGDAFVAAPLNRAVQTTGHEEPRFFFSLSKTF